MISGLKHPSDIPFFDRSSRQKARLEGYLNAGDIGQECNIFASYLRFISFNLDLKESDVTEIDRAGIIEDKQRKLVLIGRTRHTTISTVIGSLIVSVCLFGVAHAYGWC